MPNGAAANFAIGGASPVATASGNTPAFASVRSALSFKPLGISTRKPAFSGSGTPNLISLTSTALSSVSNTGRNALPESGISRTLAASSRKTGAEKRTLIGRIGRHGAFALSRSQLNSAVNAGRTVKRKRCSSVVATAGFAWAEMPLPQTSRIAAAGGSGRLQARISVRATCSFFSMPRAFNTAARASPPITFMPMRSPMPSTSHQALASTVFSTAAPLRRSTKYWSSAICPPSGGWVETTAGPPVLKLYSAAPVSVPLSGFHSGRARKVQRVPGGSGSRKS